MIGSGPGRRRCLLLLCAAIGFVPHAAGLDPHRAITQYIQTSWTSDSGLPQSSVHAIAQTSDGFLWLGTEEGLVRFDGTDFRVYTRRAHKGLASDYIGVLLADRDGSLWIGTDSGLTHYTPASTPGTPTGGLVQDGTFVTLTSRNGLAGDFVSALAQSSDGALWVGTSHGLSRLRTGHSQSPTDPSAAIESWTQSRGLPADEILALALDAGGALWIGTSQGLSRFDGARFQNWTPATGLPAGRIAALAAELDGSVWAAASGYGLVQLRENRILQSRPLSARWNQIDALLRDRDGALWIAFDRHGLGRLADGKLTFYGAANGLPSNRCTHALFEDREGSLWAGLLDAGVVQLRDGKFAVFGKPEGLAGNYIGNILQDRDGSMWIGSDSNGLNHLLPDGSVEIWDHRRGLPDQAVYSIAQTRDGALWTGFRNGVLACIHNHAVTTFTDPQAGETSLNSILEDRAGGLWVGFYGKGIARFENGRFRHLTSTGRISDLDQTPDGAIWAASDGDGLLRILGNQVTAFTTANGLPSNHVMNVYADPEGDVWVGTASGGLSRVHAGKITTWTPEQGLLEPTVGSVSEDHNGNLWLGGDSGIYRLSKRELTTGAPFLHPVAYGTSDGLRSRETVYGGMPSTWTDRTGRVWFATIRGAAVIDPAAPRADTVPPPVWIESIQFNSGSVSPRDGMSLGRGPGNMEFAFSAPTFVAPQSESFQYRLVGFDPDWISAGARRNAWYTNLPPGRYTFRVRARNHDGLWNDAGASFTFVLLPPLSRTFSAYLCYILSAILVVWFVIGLRTRSLLRRQQELQRLVAARTAELEAEKAALDAARQELHVRATYDALTGLLNRATILERLQHELERALRDGVPLGLAILDLDHFKRVNDTYGHLCGDAVITESATRIRQALRSYDMAGRYGGEEFLIVLPGWDADRAPQRVDDLLDAIRSRPFTCAPDELHLTCSLGVTTFQPGFDAPDVPQLLKRADVALYRSKNSGRNCGTFDQPAESAARFS